MITASLKNDIDDLKVSSRNPKTLVRTLVTEVVKDRVKVGVTFFSIGIDLYKFSCQLSRDVSQPLSPELSSKFSPQSA